VELNHFIITGTVHKTIEDFMLFWILVITMFVCAIVQVVYLIMSIRIRNLEREQRKNEQIISQTMSTFAEFIDAKDPYTRGHSARVSFYSGEIARRMKMSEDEVKKLEYIALMHDCGKIGIPDNILKKPDKLEPEERKIIESHTTIGGHMLEKYTAIEGIRDGAMYHHERYDGTGYPEGRKGEEIPLYARIIGIADAFDAMNSDRCYRKHLSKEVILKELEENKGKQFDPDLAEYMIEMIKDGSINVLGEGENEGEDK
jgi:putative nucleotidyltransferase with HDIG domain